MKRFFALAVITVFILVSCGKADVIIRTDLDVTRLSVCDMTTEETSLTAATNEQGLFVFIVNSSSKTFHISEECRHVKSMSEKNKVTVASSGVDDMIARGYSPCATCFGDLSTD